MSMTRMIALAAAVAAVFALALAARFGMMEPRGAGLLCRSAAAPGWCTLRGLLLPLFTVQAFGIASLAAGAFAAVRFRRGWAVPALLFGAAGMVLYNVEAASLGTILGLIALFRESPRADRG